MSLFVLDVYSFPFIDVLDGVKNMVLKDGSKALWKGLPPTLWRDVPFSAIYWMGYEECKVALEAYSNRNLVMSDLQITFIAGALSGMVCNHYNAFFFIRIY